MKKKHKQTKFSPIVRKSRRPSLTPAVTGKLDISKQGMGYVIVPGMDIDIIVKRENLKNAMHGDTVEVSIFKVGNSGKRPEGIITKIVQRGQNELIGTVQLSKFFAFIVPDNKSFNKDIFINEKNSKGLKEGDRVIVRITDWNEKLKNPEGVVIDLLNDERINEIAMKEILLSQGFTLEFPEEVIKELEQLQTEITDEEVSKRKDLRELFTLTIDPHDAKDFDDAISIRKLENGLTEVGVHIADVSHYVKPNTALDKEAYQRATSVYLPDRVLPMLPEKISNELCSLRPNEDKLTFSVLFELDSKANVKNYWIGRTVIHSNKRFTYEEAQEIIMGADNELKEQILQLHLFSQQLRQRKFDAGAINFSSEEARFILDEHGIPTDVVVKESNESHQLIEELMLLANRTVAEFVAKKNYKNEPIPFPYRIHDSPNLEKLKPFAAFAATFGHKFNLSSPEAISKSFNQMVTDTGKHPEDAILHTLGIRTMAKAVYSTDNIGHYGLAFEYYCHFTSPIRRYPDVLVHRILMQCLENHIQPISNMDEQCKHTSDRERKAMEAEREGQKYKQVEFMRKFIGDEFDAVISGVANFGFWAQTVEHKCEGFVSLLNLQDVDDFQFIEEEYALIGRRTKQKFQIGKPIRIKVIAAYLDKKQIDFDLVQ